jgi:hypothetical protein
VPTCHLTFNHSSSFRDVQAAAATNSALRLFGLVIDNQACLVSPASEQRVLHVTSPVPGLPPQAMCAALTDILRPTLGLDLTLRDTDRVRHGMLCNGEVVIEFESHESAVAAAHLLRKAYATEEERFVVGWALPNEWRAAQPRLPVYF